MCVGSISKVISAKRLIKSSYMKGGTIMMNNKKGDSDTASKNVGSFVKIDSISIDLEDVNNKGYVEKCEHFSIR